MSELTSYNSFGKYNCFLSPTILSEARAKISSNCSLVRVIEESAESNSDVSADEMLSYQQWCY